MTKRTALEVADHIIRAFDWALQEEAADMLRHQHAEIARLKAIAQRLRETLNDAYKEMSPYTRERASLVKMCRTLIDIRPEDIA